MVIKKTMQDIQERPYNKETSNDYVKSLINFLKVENKTKNTVIQILSENQSYFPKPNKDILQRNSYSSRKISSKKDMKGTLVSRTLL